MGPAMSDALDKVEYLAVQCDGGYPLCDDAIAAGAMLREQAAEITRLRRWKSTHAPRLAALEALHKTAQADAEAGREAAATLASERAANALLTDEVERLRADLATSMETVAKAQALQAEMLNERAALSAQPAAVPRWRPIETAPKDGTPFLAYRPMGCMRESSALQRDDGVIWSFGAFSAHESTIGPLKPTHWMPLPAAPQAPQQDEAPNVRANRPASAGPVE